jgi:5-methylcytosine-specific restriction endonuclease McrA
VTPGAGGNATLDHIVPVELGGTNDPSNLVTACLSCNSAKQDRTTSEFVAHLTARGVNAEGVKKSVRNAGRRRMPSAAAGLAMWNTTRAAVALVA